MAKVSFPVVYFLALLVCSTSVSAQKVSVDAERHDHYGTGPAVFPIVIHDSNSNLCSNPVNEFQLLSRLSIDTVIDAVCDGSSTAQNIASAMVPYGLDLWSTVVSGFQYTGDPGWVNELVNNPNVTGYFLKDEPDVLRSTPGDMTLANNLDSKIKAVDPTALGVNLLQ
jgi:hypothetical protein